MLKYDEDIFKKRMVFTIDGYINSQNYYDTMKTVRLRVKEWGKADVFEHIISFRGMPMTCLIDDFCFRIRNQNKFSKVYVVTDVKWLRFCFQILKLFKSEIKIFKLNSLSEAKAQFNS